jgi:tRNA dimethylallyltransferase
LSLDSLSIYKDIDIVSAKPTKEELKSIRHFGINEIYPNEYFSVTRFIDIYQKSIKEAKKENKNLIIVGGSSFYLKSMIDGLSKEPIITNDIQKQTEEKLQNLEESYNFLHNIDPIYMENIKSNDKYRIEKTMNLYLATNISPSEYFKQNPKIPIINNLDIFDIDIERSTVREKIKLRTKIMFEQGLIEEIKYLEEKYTRTPRCFGAIGIKETFEYFDNIYTKDELFEKICINTGRLAKRQQTFNKSQFNNKTSLPIEKLETKILNYFNKD